MLAHVMVSVTAIWRFGVKNDVVLTYRSRNETGCACPAVQLQPASKCMNINGLIFSRKRLERQTKKSGLGVFDAKQETPGGHDAKPRTPSELKPLGRVIPPIHDSPPQPTHASTPDDAPTPS